MEADEVRINVKRKANTMVRIFYVEGKRPLREQCILKKLNGFSLY